MQRLSIGILLVVLGAAALFASPAAADPPPTITSVTLNPPSGAVKGYSLTVTWSPNADCQTAMNLGYSPPALLAGQDPTLAVGTGVPDELAHGTTGTNIKDCTTTTFTTLPSYGDSVPSGTWYLQVIAPCNPNTDADCTDANASSASALYRIDVPALSGGGGGGSGAGGGGGGGGGSTSCVATSTCVIPLNASGAVRGQPYVHHADGTKQPIQDVSSLKAADWITTGRNDVARWVFGSRNGNGVAAVMWAGPDGSLTFTSMFFSTQGILFVQAVLRNGEVVVTQSLIDLSVKTPNAVVKAAGSPTSSRALAATAGASYTIQRTATRTIVQVYAGSVKVSDARGKHTVVVKAGFQSVVTGSHGSPSRPGRFKAPKRPFWR